VGGIHANNTYRAEFIYQNLMVQANVIDAAFRNGVKKLFLLGSSCIYPKLSPQLMAEDALLNGKLESTNEPKLVLDIVANKGHWIKFLLSEFPSIVVHAFEP
jgi:GDP-L-fucose synthase